MTITKQEFVGSTTRDRDWLKFNAIQQGLQKNSALSIIGAGTAYSMTNTAAAVDLGTTDPALIITEPGTYLLFANATLEAAAATITTQTAALKLRRTNNTAADVTGSDKAVDLPVMTTLTNTIGDFQMGPVLYVTANRDDALAVFASLSAAAGAGNITVSAARIVAIRLF